MLFSFALTAGPCLRRGEAARLSELISISTVTGIFASVMSWFFWLILVFFAAMLLDYVFGTLAARKRGEWSSTRAREGLYHKLGIAGALILSVLIDIVVGLAADTVIRLPMQFRGLFSPLCAVWFIITEFGSVCENLAKLGVTLPAFLLRSIGAIREGTEKQGEALTGTVKEGGQLPEKPIKERDQADR